MGLSRQQFGRWHLDRRVKGVEIAGEPPDDGEATGPPVHGALGWQRRPGKRQVDGYVLAAVGFDKRNELREQLLRAPELVAERATHGQVVVECGSERDHALAPVGQGRATCLSAWWSTFA